MDGAEIRDNGTVASFSEVSGRTGDLIDLGDGVRFHGYSLMVCAEENAKIVAYQLRVRKAAGKVTFVAQTLAALSESERNRIRKHAAEVASIDFSFIDVEESSELVKAPSGKIRLVVEEP